MSRNGKIIAALLVGLAPVLALALWNYAPQMRHVATWQNMASPGPLSSGHAFLKGNCGACHTPVKGVEDASCAPAMRTRPPCPAPADGVSCRHRRSEQLRGCHKEHDAGLSLRGMDHAALADIILRWRSGTRWF